MKYNVTLLLNLLIIAAPAMAAQTPTAPCSSGLVNATLGAGKVLCGSIAAAGYGIYSLAKAIVPSLLTVDGIGSITLGAAYHYAATSNQGDIAAEPSQIHEYLPETIQSQISTERCRQIENVTLFGLLPAAGTFFGLAPLAAQASSVVAGAATLGGIMATGAVCAFQRRMLNQDARTTLRKNWLISTGAFLAGTFALGAFTSSFLK